VIGGGIQGFTEANKSAIELRKELYKDMLRRRLSPEESELKAAQAEYYRSRANPAATTMTDTGIPEGYKVGYDKAGKKILVPQKQKSITERLNDDLAKALRGEMDWEDIKATYPLHIDKIEKARMSATPIFQSPSFVRGTGSPVSRVRSFFSQRQAELNPKTLSVISQIKTEADIKEFISRIDEAEKKGIDVKAILEYFGKG